MTYPAEICWDCGKKHGRAPAGHVSTYYMGKCGWCGEEGLVTDPMDFGCPPALKGGKP